MTAADIGLTAAVQVVENLHKTLRVEESAEKDRGNQDDKP